MTEYAILNSEGQYIGSAVVRSYADFRSLEHRDLYERYAHRQWNGRKKRPCRLRPDQNCRLRLKSVKSPKEFSTEIETFWTGAVIRLPEVQPFRKIFDSVRELADALAIENFSVIGSDEWAIGSEA